MSRTRSNKIPANDSVVTRSVTITWPRNEPLFSLILSFNRFHKSGDICLLSLFGRHRFESTRGTSPLRHDCEPKVNHGTPLSLPRILALPSPLLLVLRKTLGLTTPTIRTENRRVVHFAEERLPNALIFFPSDVKSWPEWRRWWRSECDGGGARRHRNIYRNLIQPGQEQKIPSS